MTAISTERPPPRKWCTSVCAADSCLTLNPLLGTASGAPAWRRMVRRLPEEAFPPRLSHGKHGGGSQAALDRDRIELLCHLASFAEHYHAVAVPELFAERSRCREDAAASLPEVLH